MTLRFAGSLAVVGIVIVAATVACSGSSGGTGAASASATAHCAIGSRSCRCESSSFSLEGDEAPATSCAASSLTSPSTESGDVQCCYDLDSDGFTTSCDCASYVCIETEPTDECVCGWSRYESDRSGTVVPTCKRSDAAPSVGTTPRSLCCEDVAENVTGTANACSCNGNYADCATRPGYEKAKTVTSCGTVARTCGPGKRNATSCDGLKWKPEAQSTSSSSSSGSSSSPKCTSDSSCSGKCSGSCYACRSGDCKCGYKGTSGSCIY